MTCFIINIDEKPNNDGIRATIQRFDGEQVNRHDLYLLALFRIGEVTQFQAYDTKGGPLDPPG